MSLGYKKIFKHQNQTVYFGINPSSAKTIKFVNIVNEVYIIFMFIYD